ncbi:hypothetical protein OG21DRAFT_1513589 [Imleria badia]|nr:hypothetical protein OG21DRAFT_1513589 [Imleria badia]
MAFGTAFGQLCRGLGQMPGVAVASSVFQSRPDTELRGKALVKRLALNAQRRDPVNLCDSGHHQWFRFIQKPGMNTKIIGTKLASVLRVAVVPNVWRRHRICRVPIGSRHRASSPYSRAYANKGVPRFTFVGASVLTSLLSRKPKPKPERNGKSDS